ncbi:hypothetical protein C8R45DRAFT_1159721 [Mycena sanguinolenta]|nr:hypothetical protein C8R45DRAFT_1159721 [Mycena sanguinolenta]
MSGLCLAANMVYVTANVLADVIFIFRCYAIWNFQIKIILFPMLLTLGVAGIGYFNAISTASGKLILSTFFTPALFDLSVGISLFTTFVLMALTGSTMLSLLDEWRSQWDACGRSRAQLDESSELKWPAHITPLESGALYVCGGVAYIILGIVGAFTFDVMTDGIVLAQLVGIAPTIIAVRVALGQSVENMDSFFVPSPRAGSSFHKEVVGTAVHLVHDEVLYIRPKAPTVLFLFDDLDKQNRNSFQTVLNCLKLF